MFRRLSISRVKAALADTPVVLINGARQTGKTTLVRDLLNDGPSRKYLTFDEASILTAAKDDPSGFIEALPEHVVLDEIQHVPELFPAIKAEVDRNRKPGRFLLTGSANVLLLPKLSESLAGRMEIITLQPLSQSEISGHSRCFVDWAFDGMNDKQLSYSSSSDLVSRIVKGGYPEPLQRKDATRRRAWFDSYLTSILERDVREMSNIERLSALPQLLSLLASRIGGLLNASDVSIASKIPYATLHRYLSLLEATFLFQPLPAWTTNIGLRIVKSPKVMLNDTGLGAALLSVDEQRLKDDRNLVGQFLENFVATEILKQAGWAKHPVKLFHFRTSTQREVDIVLERADGRVIGIEVKASASVGEGDVKGLTTLEEVAEERFLGGVVLYTGRSSFPIRKNIKAVPVPALWS